MNTHSHVDGISHSYDLWFAYITILSIWGGEGVDGGWYPQEEVQEEQNFFTLILLAA